jgi:hypothetical protein
MELGLSIKSILNVTNDDVLDEMDGSISICHLFIGLLQSLLRRSGIWSISSV